MKILGFNPQKKEILSDKHKNYSKFLSYVLRHKPESIDIILDENGWVEVSTLLEASQKAGQNISRELLKEIVETNDKKRFAFSETEDRIRASQGHSVKNIDLDLEPIEPPEILYHGTVKKFIKAIEKGGLQKMNRQYVHLSSTKEIATSVGSRRGKPIILKVRALSMYKVGYHFYLSANGVWLTDTVPFEYII